MSTKGLQLSVVLAITLIVIAFFAWKYWRKRTRKDKFSYSTPATPRAREAVGDVFDGLRRMVALWRELEAASPDIKKIYPDMSRTVSALDRTQKTIETTPPTYANYLAIYSGLVSTDKALLDLARTYRDAGREADHAAQPRDDVPVTQPDAAQPSDDMSPSAEKMAEFGNVLIAMGAQLRYIVSTIHRLGDALELE